MPLGRDFRAYEVATNTSHSFLEVFYWEGGGSGVPRGPGFGGFFLGLNQMARVVVVGGPGGWIGGSGFPLFACLFCFRWGFSYGGLDLRTTGAEAP